MQCWLRLDLFASRLTHIVVARQIRLKVGMDEFKLDTRTGHFLVEDYVVLPLPRAQFETLISARLIEIENVAIVDDSKSFHFSGNINSYEFGINVSYLGNELSLCWLAWEGGFSGHKGYATSESELIADKNALSKFISTISGKPPETKQYNHDVFMFEWGNISTSACLQAVIATIGVHWRS